MRFFRIHLAVGALLHALSGALLPASANFGSAIALNAGAEMTAVYECLTNAQATSRGRYNGRLVFSSDRHNSGLSIWTMNADGSSPTRLTDQKSRTERLPSFARVYDRSPAWSPDGRKVAFISNRNYVSGLYVMDADGNDARLVTDQVPSPSLPTWSPNGNKIALNGGGGSLLEGESVSDIYVVNIDGSGLVKLTSDSGLNGAASWSPDGQQIVFSSNRDPDRRLKIWVMNADGSNQRRLTQIHGTNNPVFYSDSWPSWSPDGTKIVFNGYRDFNGTRNCNAVNCSEIFVMNADGTSDHALTNDPNRGGTYETPKWSPDGNKIVTSLMLGTVADMKAGIDRGRAIIVMDADGNNPINISNRSDHAFFDVSPDWQPLSAPVAPSSSVVGFSATSYSAYEDAKTIALTVKRTGNLNGLASCSFATQDGTANIKNDYGPAFGTLRFASGEASKTITIPLTDSGHTRGSRSFKIALFDNEGNATFVGGIREATVTILDRDATPRPRNPIDETSYFVRQHYVDFLNREPDLDGFAFWMNETQACGADVQCTEVKRINVSAAFYLSIEFQEIGCFVYRFNLLNPYNTGDSPLISTLRGIQEIGRGVIVGQPGWEDQLKSNKLDFVRSYHDDDRLVLSFGRTNEEWIDLLFQYVRLYSGVSLPQTKRDALVAGLNTGIETRPTAFIKVVDDEQFKAALFNQLFVLMQYHGYLRRDPDPAGFDYWLNKLNQFNGNFIEAEMVKAFISSTEYRQRFSS